MEDNQEETTTVEESTTGDTTTTEDTTTEEETTTTEDNTSDDSATSTDSTTTTNNNNTSSDATKDIDVGNYNLFDTGKSTANTLKSDIITATDTLTGEKTKLSNDSIFMGPICDSCVQGFDVVNLKLKTSQENMDTIMNHLQTASDLYNSGDKNAAGLFTESKIDTSNLISGSNVANAVQKYGDELANADYSTVNSNIFTTTTTEYINGQPVQVTHVVINDASQIKGAPANGSYASGLEKASDAGTRLNATVLVNGSHFTSSGAEDLQGPNNIAIVNGQIVHDGVSGGNELLLDKNGNIYNASGKTAQQLVDDGVVYSFACHSTPVIQNGDTSSSYQEGRSYKRTVIGQSAPGEYYIITDSTANNRLSDTAEYLKSKGCNNAYSLDQGGSVSLALNGQLVNNPSDSTGERPVGDFLYFT